MRVRWLISDEAVCEPGGGPREGLLAPRAQWKAAFMRGVARAARLPGCVGWQGLEWRCVVGDMMAPDKGDWERGARMRVERQAKVGLRTARMREGKWDMSCTCGSF